MTEVTQLVLIGPHGAGKTTVGRLLAEALRWRFDGEIGETLRREALAMDPQAHALQSSSAFDEEVIRRELARDRDAQVPRVIETWHPGNYGYARRRSPQVAARFWRVVLGSIRRQRGTLVQPLVISEDIARRRLSEPGPDETTLVRFFLDVARDAEGVARACGLVVLPAIGSDDRSPEEIVRIVLGRI